MHVPGREVCGRGGGERWLQYNIWFSLTATCNVYTYILFIIPRPRIACGRDTVVVIIIEVHGLTI